MCKKKDELLYCTVLELTRLSASLAASPMAAVLWLLLRGLLLPIFCIKHCCRRSFSSCGYSSTRRLLPRLLLTRLLFPWLLLLWLLLLWLLLPW